MSPFPPAAHDHAAANAGSRIAGGDSIIMLLERSFAHCCETRGMRRTHLHGYPNILKSLLGHMAEFNLALVMRSMFGLGKPRKLQGDLAHPHSGCLGLDPASSWNSWAPDGRV